MNRNRLVIFKSICLILIMAFVASTFSACGEYLLTINTNSMSPEFTVNDVIALDTNVDISTLSKGDIIGYRTYIESEGMDAIFAHRIVDIVEKDGKRYFQTKGDANDVPDQMTEDEYLPEDKVVGKYMYIAKKAYR